jgi:hypothetical protein
LPGEGLGLFLAVDGVGLLAGDGDAVVEGVPLGEGVGLVHAIGLAVTGIFGTATAFGPVLAK